MDVQGIENAAKELVEARMESVRELARRRAAVSNVEDQLREAQAADHEAYKAAVKAGWSVDELKKVGLAPLDTPAPRRRRKSANRASNAAPTAAQQTATEAGQ